jgi:flagellar basal body rod protein FlgC
MSAIATAAHAISNAFVRLDQGAQKVQRGVAGAPDADPAAGMVEMMEAKHQVTANVSVVRIADSMMHELLNLQARR